MDSKTAPLTARITSATGPASDIFLRPQQLAAADAAIDAILLTPSASPSDKLTGCMVKAFLRLPFEDGPIDAALNRFIEADYIISNDAATDSRKATSDSHIKAGKTPSDIWSVSRVITDALSSGPYKPIAERVGKQMAMLIYGCEKVTSHNPHPFDVLESAFSKAGISPFASIHLFEFAGNPRSVVANTKRGLAKLLGSFHFHRGAGATMANPSFSGFVSATQTGGIPGRAAGINYIIAKNVFNHGAVESSVNAQENVRNLLAAFSDTLPDTGKLYVSSSFNDPIDMRDMPDLLDSTGFKSTARASLCSGGTPSYILERDFTLKAPASFITSTLEKRAPHQLPSGDPIPTHRR